MDFTPVDLVSPSGRPWTARTAIELSNLAGKGYRPVEQATAPDPEPAAGAPAWTEPEPATNDAADQPAVD